MYVIFSERLRIFKPASSMMFSNNSTFYRFFQTWNRLKTPFENTKKLRKSIVFLALVCWKKYTFPNNFRRVFSPIWTLRTDRPPPPRKMTTPKKVVLHTFQRILSKKKKKKKKNSVLFQKKKNLVIFFEKKIQKNFFQSIHFWRQSPQRACM